MENIIVNFDKKDLFIVPNSLVEYGEIQLESYKAQAELIANSNGLVVSEHTLTVHTIVVGEEEKNLTDHHELTVLPNGETVYTRFLSSYIPVELFTGKKEGDEVEALIPLATTSEDDNIIVLGKVTLQLSQLKYGYRQFGSFDQVLNDLIERSATPVLWVSRHRMTPAQKEDLERGLGAPAKVVSLDQTVQDPSEISTAAERCGAACVAAVLPLHMIQSVLPLLGSTPLIVAKSGYSGTARSEKTFVHLGWTRYKRVEIESEPW